MFILFPPLDIVWFFLPFSALKGGSRTGYLALAQWKGRMRSYARHPSRFSLKFSVPEKRTQQVSLYLKTAKTAARSYLKPAKSAACLKRDLSRCTPTRRLLQSHDHNKSNYTQATLSRTGLCQKHDSSQRQRYRQSQYSGKCLQSKH